MISYSVFLNVLSLVLLIIVVYYYHYKLIALNLIVERVVGSHEELETKVNEMNKKDPYAEYRNSKGLLSARAIKEAKYGKS